MLFCAEKLLKHQSLYKSTAKQKGFGLKKTRQLNRESGALPEPSMKALSDLSGAVKYKILKH